MSDKDKLPNESDEPIVQDTADDDDLDFDRAEYDDDAPPTRSCAFCQQTLRDAYYEVNGAASCERCLGGIRAYRDWGSPGLRFLKALLFGAVAAAGGAALYYGIAALTGYELGLVALVVGLMVGGAVRVGGQRRGGAGYQVLAILLTYLAITVTYMGPISKGFEKAAQKHRSKLEAKTKAAGKATATLAERGTPARQRTRPMLFWVVVFGFAFVWPIASIYLGGLQGIMGLLIVGFALYEAWRLCKRVPFEVDGPFELAGAAEDSA